MLVLHILCFVQVELAAVSSSCAVYGILDYRRLFSKSITYTQFKKSVQKSQTKISFISFFALSLQKFNILFTLDKSNTFLKNTVLKVFRLAMRLTHTVLNVLVRLLRWHVKEIVALFLSKLFM